MGRRRRRPATADQAPTKPPARRPRRRWIILGGVAVAVAAVAGAVLALGRHSDRDRGLALAQKGQFAAAEPLLLRAAQRDPGNADVAAALARGKLDANDPDGAVPHLRRWCDLRPDQPDPARLLMDALVRLGRPDEALEAGRRYLAGRPQDADFRKNVATLALRVGRADEAAEDLRRCLDADPGNAQLRMQLAEAALLRGEHDEAVTILDELLRENPRSAAVQITLAQVYVESGRAKRAIPLLREVAERAPAHKLAALYQLSLALARDGQAEEAARVGGQVRQIHEAETRLADSRSTPGDLPLQVRNAEWLMGVGRDEDAMGLLRGALGRDPDYAPAHRLMATLYEKQGRPEQAADHRRRGGPAP
jgi:predicted Zn-dependent protease